jgi:hypothetical protein
MPNIVLHKGQSEILADLFIKKICRNAVAVCSRGWGKSFFAASAAMVAVNELLQLMPSVTNKNVYIIAPTYSQATDIYFPLLMYTFSVADMCIKPPSKDTGRFIFPNGVELHLVSYEAVERLRGSGAYFVVCDEVSSWTKMGGHKEAWQGILEPCIVTRWSPKRAKAINAKSPGRSLTISTPKGYNYLYDLYNLQETDNTWKSYHFDYHSSPYLDAEEIERLRHTYDPLYFAREYLASFEESGNSVFYCFDRRIHVDRDIKDIEEHEDVYCCIDFNVSIQATSVFVIRGGQVFFIDEFKGQPDTEQLAIAINGRYKSKPDAKIKRKIYAFPDPSGRSRKTSASVGVTDFTILQNAGFIVQAHKAAPAIVDSVACVNRMLKTAAGEINMYIHPRCSGLIMSLERTAWVDNNTDTAAIDKKEGVEHFSDGVRYGIEYMFPIQSHKKATARGFGF